MAGVLHAGDLALRDVANAFVVLLQRVTALVPMAQAVVRSFDRQSRCADGGQAGKCFIHAIQIGVGELVCGVAQNMPAALGIGGRPVMSQP